MYTTIQSIIHIQRQTIGARSLGLSRLAELLAERSDCAKLIAHVEEALELHRQAGRLAFDWRRAQKNDAAHLPGAKQADRRLDRAVTSFYDWLTLLAETGEPEEQAAAVILLEKLFPNGPGEIVSPSYQEEHELVTRLLEALDQPELADARAAVDSESVIGRIDRLNEAYGALLVRPERLEYAAVKQADQAAFEAFVEVVARLVGRWPSNRPDDLAARTAVLQPLLDQQEHLSDQRTRGGPDEDREETDEAAAPEATSEASNAAPDEPAAEPQPA